MQCLSPLLICFITLLSLEQQLLALPTGVQIDSNRWNSEKNQHDLKVFEDPKTQLVSRPPALLDTTQETKHLLWRHLLFRGSPTQESIAPLQQVYARTSRLKRQIWRKRRHSNSIFRGHQQRAQLMRVGCVLGTCQVQNLSHRLYQLIGQSGREGSSPINPRSPHSYG